MTNEALSDAKLALGETASHRPALRGTRHMAVAGHYAAAHAAFQILEAGGNAFYHRVSRAERKLMEMAEGRSEE